MSLLRTEMRPQARAALEEYLEAEDGDLGDSNALADAVYRAAWNDCMVAMRTFSTTADSIERAAFHLRRAGDQLETMRALWHEMPVLKQGTGERA